MEQHLLNDEQQRLREIILASSRGGFLFCCAQIEDIEPESNSLHILEYRKPAQSPSTRLLHKINAAEQLYFARSETLICTNPTHSRHRSHDYEQTSTEDESRREKECITERERAYLGVLRSSTSHHHHSRSYLSSLCMHLGRALGRFGWTAFASADDAGARRHRGEGGERKGKDGGFRSMRNTYNTC